MHTSPRDPYNWNLKILTILLALLFLTTISKCQSAPLFTVVNATLGASTTYKIQFNSFNAYTTATTFTIVFNQSYIRPIDGNNNCLVTIGSTPAPVPQCNCTNRVCTVKPMVIQPAQPIYIELNHVNNPLFVFPQNVTVNIYFTPTLSNNYTVVIPSTQYSPMPIIINNLTQSDYGVGYTPVTYTLNVSLFYISKNTQLQVVIPP
jgi:hypothetical protein